MSHSFPRLLIAAAAAAAGLVGLAGGAAHAALDVGASPAGNGSGALACTAAALPTRPGHDVDVATSLGGTTATLTGVSGHSYLGVPRLRQPRLSIAAPGRAAWVTTPRPLAGTPGRGVLVAAVHHHDHGYSLCLARFALGRPAVALLALTSAFNQCCTVVDTFGPGLQPANRLQSGAWPVHVRVGGGTALLVTGDARYLGRFADYADSGAPLRILTIRNGRQTDVTGSHAALLRQDAHRWWRLFSERDFGLGFLACWAADQERLGHDALVRHRLADLDAAHRLTVPKGLGSLWPHGSAYVTALRAFLHRTGYLTAG